MFDVAKSQRLVIYDQKNHRDDKEYRNNQAAWTHDRCLIFMKYTYLLFERQYLGYKSPKLWFVLWVAPGWFHICKRRAVKTISNRLRHSFNHIIGIKPSPLILFNDDILSPIIDIEFQGLPMSLVVFFFLVLITWGKKILFKCLIDIALRSLFHSLI